MAYQRKNKSVPTNIYREMYAVDFTSIINGLVAVGFRPFHLATSMGITRARLLALRAGEKEPTFTEAQVFLELHRQFIPTVPCPPTFWGVQTMERELHTLREANEKLKAEIRHMDFLLSGK